MKKMKKKVLGLLAFLLICISIYEGSVYTQAATLKLNHTSVVLFVGETAKLTLNKVASGQVRWSTNNSSIVSVSKKGKITALKRGKTTIGAKYKNKAYMCKVNVKSAKLSATKLTLRVGQGYALDIVNSKGKCTWNSMNTVIAEINSNGYIKPKTDGNTLITANIGKEKYICNLKVVADFTEADFVFDEPSEEGYTNYIDYSTEKGSSWYWYWNDASEKGNDNRGVNIGDTYDDFISAYGYCEYETVTSGDEYHEKFSSIAYPRIKSTLEYQDSLTQNKYYKTLYFDRNGTVVLIVWHR